MKLSDSGPMLVGPNNTLEENNMDETNTVQEVQGQVVDTGPLPIDVLEAEMTLELRGAMDLEEQLRAELAKLAPNAHPQTLMHNVMDLHATRDRITQLRRLSRDRSAW